MAFSMFLRRSACTSSVLQQQIMRLTTQPILTHNAVASMVPIKCLALPEAKSTPTLNSVRSLRTSPVCLSEKAHDHAKLWVVEKATSAALVPLIPLSLLMPNKIFDSILAILITAHSFWGLEAIVVDYVRASIFGPIIPKICMGLLYLFSIATLGGLFYIIGHDIGIANTIRQLWSVKAGEQKA